jgi:hypothetical protein
MAASACKAYPRITLTIWEPNWGIEELKLGDLPESSPTTTSPGINQVSFPNRLPAPLDPLLGRSEPVAGRYGSLFTPLLR